MDIQITRDYSRWTIRALTLRGRAVLEALEIPDGSSIGSATHLRLLEHAQAAELEVSA